MALSDLARADASLSEDERRHLRRLMASWNVLADFCFSDLVLYVPVDEELVVFGHMRPATSQTIYRDDLVGEVRTRPQRPIITEALEGGRQLHAEVDSAWVGERVRVLALPVRRRGRIVAVLAQEAALSMLREPGELETNYTIVFERFVSMISSGVFPYDTDDDALPDSPRVGDGVLVPDGSAEVSYASPNATSALTRAGVSGRLRGRPLIELGLGHALVAEVTFLARPVAQELETATGAVLSLRSLPLIDTLDPTSVDQTKGLAVTGTVVLVRDITDLRRRDRLLISKDATIREIHHRVKNNLQTISSLLRLQGRRLTEPEAVTAIEESVRRIRSIALVHEILSREAGDDVSFIDVVRPLVRMVEEGLVSPDRPLRFVISGDPGVMASPTATSLAVVLTELLQNVMEHAYPDELAMPEPHQVRIEFRNDGTEIEIKVVDDGRGLPDGFDLRSTTSLGLSIVHGLVTTELGGAISFDNGNGPPQRRGTVVTLSVPLTARPPSI